MDEEMFEGLVIFMIITFAVAIPMMLGSAAIFWFTTEEWWFRESEEGRTNCQVMIGIKAMSIADNCFEATIRFLILDESLAKAWTCVKAGAVAAIVSMA